MNTRLIVVTDLGHLRAYREVQGPEDRQPHLVLLDEWKRAAAHQRWSEQVSDQAGRFPRGSGVEGIPGDLSAGERLNLEAERTCRAIREVADRINTLLADEEVTECLLAASAPIHKQLLEALTPEARGKIGQVLASDLVKTDPRELPFHFPSESPSWRA